MVPADAFRHVPVLTGSRVRLEPLGPAVLEPYWQALEDPEGRRLTGTHAEFTREQAENWLRTRAEHHDRADWAAVRIEDGEYLGEAVVLDLDAENESAGYRVALAGPHVYGRGYGTEVTRLVVDHALDTVGLHRLELEVFAYNPRARRVYEKCGFRLEGRRRDALLWEGSRHDVLVMSVLRTDPRPGH
jgi:RimJ/RimL family protein N-acetyltransferase